MTVFRGLKQGNQHCPGGSLLQATSTSFTIPLLFFSAAVYLLSVLGIGLFISTISKTQQQALMAAFLFYLPAILLSGFMLPIENMPEVIQWSTYLNPLRYFLVIIKRIFLKGNGLAVMWPQLLYMLVPGAAVLSISALRFKKRPGQGFREVFINIITEELRRRP